MSLPFTIEKKLGNAGWVITGPGLEGAFQADDDYLLVDVAAQVNHTVAREFIARREIEHLALGCEESARDQSLPCSSRRRWAIRAKVYRSLLEQFPEQNTEAEP